MTRLAWVRREHRNNYKVATWRWLLFKLNNTTVKRTAICRIYQNQDSTYETWLSDEEICQVLQTEGATSHGTCR